MQVNVHSISYGSTPYVIGRVINIPTSNSSLEFPEILKIIIYLYKRADWQGRREYMSTNITSDS